MPYATEGHGIRVKETMIPKGNQDISFLEKVTGCYVRKMTNAHYFLFMPIVLFCLPLLLSNQKFLSVVSLLILFTQSWFIMTIVDMGLKKTQILQRLSLMKRRCC